MGCSLIYTRKIEANIDGDLEVLLKKKFKTPYVLDRMNIDWLSGLKDAGIKGADKLIEAIEKYDEIKLELRC